MSFNVIRWVMSESKSQGLDQLVLLRIADHTSRKTGIAYPAVTTLARECGVSKNTVLRALANLANLGELTVHHRSKNGKKISNSYRINAAEWSLTDTEWSHTETAVVSDRDLNQVLNQFLNQATSSRKSSRLPEDDWSWA